MPIEFLDDNEVDICQREDIKRRLENWDREYELEMFALLEKELATIPEDIFGKSTQPVVGQFNDYLTQMKRRHIYMLSLSNFCLSQKEGASLLEPQGIALLIPWHEAGIVIREVGSDEWYEINTPTYISIGTQIYLQNATASILWNSALFTDEDGAVSNLNAYSINQIEEDKSVYSLTINASPNGGRIPPPAIGVDGNFYLLYGMEGLSKLHWILFVYFLLRNNVSMGDNPFDADETAYYIDDDPATRIPLLEGENGNLTIYYNISEMPINVPTEGFEIHNEMIAEAEQLIRDHFVDSSLEWNDWLDVPYYHLKGIIHSQDFRNELDLIVFLSSTVDKTPKGIGGRVQHPDWPNTVAPSLSNDTVINLLTILWGARLDAWDLLTEDLLWQEYMGLRQYRLKLANKIWEKLIEKDDEVSTWSSSYLIRSKFGYKNSLGGYSLVELSQLSILELLSIYSELTAPTEVESDNFLGNFSNCEILAALGELGLLSVSSAVSFAETPVKILASMLSELIHEDAEWLNITGKIFEELGVKTEGFGVTISVQGGVIVGAGRSGGAMFAWKRGGSIFDARCYALRGNVIQIQQPAASLDIVVTRYQSTVELDEWTGDTADLILQGGPLISTVSSNENCSLTASVGHDLVFLDLSLEGLFPDLSLGVGSTVTITCEQLLGIVVNRIAHLFN